MYLSTDIISKSTSIVDKCRIPTALKPLSFHNSELCNNKICSWKTLGSNIYVQYLPLGLTQVPLLELLVWCGFEGTFLTVSIFLFDQTSDLWNKRHSVAIGDVHECKLIRRKEITAKQVDHIWKSMTVAQYVKLLFEHLKCVFLCVFIYLFISNSQTF